MNKALKIAIVGSGQTQRQLAAACGIPESRFSSIVNGWAEPRERERHAIAAALSEAVEVLFKGHVDERGTAEPVTAR
jgi:transcriptional regulator with XRE-family HTH domain